MTATHEMTREQLAGLKATLEAKFNADSFISAFEREQFTFELQRVSATLEGMNNERSIKARKVSGTRAFLDREDFDASALDNISVSRDGGEIIVKVGDLITFRRQTKVAYTGVSVNAYTYSEGPGASRVDLSASFTKGTPSPSLPAKGHGIEHIGFGSAVIPD